MTVLAVLMMAQWNLQAQRPHPGPPHRGPGLEKLAEELGITDEQKAEMKVLRESHRTEVEALMEKEFADREERREAMNALREEHQEAMDAVLTEAQREKLTTLKAAAKEDRAANRKAMREKHEALRSELQAYRETNILPVMREQRAKLEAELSAEDKATIAALRAKRAAHRAARPDLEPGERGERPKPTEAQREAFRADREQVKALVEKYDSEITGLLEEVEDQRESWQEGMQEIGEKYAPEGRQDRPGKGKRGAMRENRLEGKRGPAMRGRGIHAPHRRGGPMHREETGKVGFLLLDPNAETPATAEGKADFAEVRVFPNPAAARNTVSYKLKEAGHFRVELRDKDGLVLNVISNQYRQAGDYQEEVDLSDYAPGTYYLSIVGAEGVISKKVVIAK